LSNRIHGYTQTGGNRPFGVALLIGGFTGGEARLYETDPSGAFVGYKAAALGNRAESVRARLERRFTAGGQLDDALAAAFSSLVEGAAEARADTFEGAVVTEEGFRRLTDEEIDALSERQDEFGPGSGSADTPSGTPGEGEE
ncbi:MAG: hypothetical protein R3185_06635, partial [Candidatus Thermoplasmatota archaeon]|nr:hypothetical protein [Candidatus Thermoplasmatota archaeon]